MARTKSKCQIPAANSVGRSNPVQANNSEAQTLGNERRQVRNALQEEEKMEEESSQQTASE